MKYLKTYENYSDIESECNYILIDLIDDGIEIDIITRENIIKFDFHGKFIPYKYIETFDHLNSFLESEGYRYFSNGTFYETYEQRRKSFEDGNRLSLLTINYIKDSESANEELRSDVYKSAADKLTKMGHKKRPEELMKWHEITKQREIDAKKLEVLNDCKQMGVYQLYLGYKKGGQKFDYKGDFYINLVFDSYDLEERYSGWKEGNDTLWINFSFGVIPVNEDGQKFCEEVAKPIIGLGGDKITYWLGAFCLNISRSIDPENEPIRFYPENMGYFEEYEGQWHLSNRSSAIQFRNTLYKIFSGDIIIRETGDKPGGMKEDIIEELCNMREHDIDEYEDVMNSIKRMNLNKLYKD